MAFEKLEKKINKLSKAIKQGRVTEEIADEISDVVKEAEQLGDEAKQMFSSKIAEMKKALKKM